MYLLEYRKLVDAKGMLKMRQRQAEDWIDTVQVTCLTGPHAPDEEFGGLQEDGLEVARVGLARVV